MFQGTAQQGHKGCQNRKTGSSGPLSSLAADGAPKVAVVPVTRPRFSAGNLGRQDEKERELARATVSQANTAQIREEQLIPPILYYIRMCVITQTCI